MLLQEDLLRVMEWSSCNNMVLHKQKFDLMIHEARHETWIREMPFLPLYQSYLVSPDTRLYPVEELCDLGLVISKDLSWTSHMNSVRMKARSMTAWALSVFRSRDQDTMITLYKSMIRSHLEYCCLLWNPVKICEIESIEAVQRDFTSKIYGLSHLNYWDRLKSLNLMSLQRRRERFIIINVWKILNGLCPNHCELRFRDPSRLGIQAIVPPLRRCTPALQTRYDASFSVLGPKLWNVLPPKLTEVKCANSFKKQLSNYLLTLPDEPPVTGYARTHSNSIIEVARATWQSRQ